MKRNFAIGFLVFVLLFLSAADFYFLEQDHPPTRPALKQVDIPPIPVSPSEVPKHYPLPQLHATSEKLPSLQRSDAVMRKELVGLFGPAALLRFFPMQDIIRHIVVTIDNLLRQTVAVRLLPVKPVNGAFLTSSDRNHGLFIAQENAARYAPYVHIAEMVDTKYLVTVYVKLYPLFEQAYQDLGYPNGDFNDRLIAVIDHLLSAPAVNGPLAVVQSHILYQFADPALEASSAGHKILLRMGRENEQRIKVKLKAIRHELTGSRLSL